MRVLGVLSGTSMNAKEFLLCEIKSENKIIPVEYFSEKYKEEEKRILYEITQKGRDIERISLAHDIVGISFAGSLKKFIKDKKAELIGFHGQTVFHKEIGEKHRIKAITSQIGEPLFMSYVSNLPVVYDFRKSDIVAGGRGAPLSPLIHYILFRKIGNKVCVINLGGIANISIIRGENFSNVRGFDIGPANALCDFIAKNKLGLDFDPQGKFARKGKVVDEAFTKILEFFKERKHSLGIEVEEAKQKALEILGGEKPEDALRTAVEVSVHLISKTINKVKPSVVILCGGGVKNKFLIERIKEESKHPVISSEEVGIKPEYVEPILFAFLAYLRIRNKRINMKNITGAKYPYLPGKICKF